MFFFLTSRLLLVPQTTHGYLVDQCWDSEFTRQRCCSRGALEGDSECWQSPYSFQSCCTGDPLCWQPSDGSLSYDQCCLVERATSEAAGCWNGLFTYGRCCSRDLVRSSSDCATSPEAAEFLELATAYVRTNRTSPRFTAAFKHISDHWPCPEAVALGLLYSLDSNVQSGWDSAEVYLETVRRVMRYSGGAEAAVQATVAEYEQRLVRRLDAVARLNKPETLDVVLPHCGEDLLWLVDGLKWRWEFLEEAVQNFSRFIWVNKCPRRRLRPEVQTQLDELRQMFQAFVELPVYESIIGQECSGNLDYLVNMYEDFSEYSLFVHPDLEEHMPSTEVFFDTLFFVCNGYFGQVFHPDIQFLPLGLNYLKPFWARHERYRHSFKRFYAKLFSLSVASLAPEPAHTSLYCCAQFLVRRDALRLRPRQFFQHALALINDAGALGEVFGFPGHGLADYDRVNKVFCEYMMLFWQIFFGQSPQLLRREDTPELPLYFKTRNLQPA